MPAHKRRARGLGLPLDGTTGPDNNITDVDGVQVGYTTVIKGAPEDYTSYQSDFTRSGVTPILPRGKARTTVVAGMHSFNGYGELTGVNYLRDYGQLAGPIMLTNTYSVGVVRDAAYRWFADNDLIEELYLFGEPVEGATLLCPVVGETYDGVMNNGRGFNITADHANYDYNLGSTSAVGIFPRGISPFEVLDMAGNVWEWTADWYDGEYYANSPARNPPGPEGGSRRTLRGGSWDSDPS